MGLKNGTQVLKFLRTAAPGAWKLRVDPTVGFTVFVVDFYSLLFSFMNGLSTVAALRQRLTYMLQQHRACALPDEKRPIYSIFTLEEHARAPPNKEIERDRRDESSTKEPYSEFVELAATSALVTATPQTIALADYQFGDNVALPSDFGRIRCTPVLMRRFVSFLSRVLKEEAEKLMRSDPLHYVVVDGFREETPSVPSTHTQWTSHRGTLEPSLMIGEGEFKATHWATQAFDNDQNVVVHVNDGDIIALLALFSMRVPHKHTIVGAMCTSYSLPYEGSSTVVKEEKVFNSAELVRGIWTTLNTNPLQVRLLPQTYLFFLFMCGNDYVDSLPQIGPAKIAAVLTKRDGALLDGAVKFLRSADSTRVSIKINERAILTALVAETGAVLAEQRVTSQHLAGWIRRIAWTMDYFTNLWFLDPFEKSAVDGKSLHGYRLLPDNKCAIDSDVSEPTLVEIGAGGANSKETAFVANNNKKKTKRVDEAATDGATNQQRVEPTPAKKARTTKAQPSPSAKIPPPATFPAATDDNDIDFSQIPASFPTLADWPNVAANDGDLFQQSEAAEQAAAAAAATRDTTQPPPQHQPPPPPPTAQPNAGPIGPKVTIGEFIKSASVTRGEYRSFGVSTFARTAAVLRQRGTVPFGETAES